ncbi:Outer membrane protein beta-barrel domain-containing protein [Mucilaginibacter mallensis]|uniref:Outer membrane protein beta-barrel domain-containing protein n=1 Tax=Mucilaginibacter mallensis TaxID=652787 RepID=A0A1H2B1K0_MUCMA|nr:porin family protein [Mucilaginibacter mallensis]SDT51952.1 Outer membrane protein beta-barrel domain-containing protein [Mucilaginibacter mallensis]
MKKSIFYLSVFGLLVLCLKARAQDAVAIGVRGGISIPNLTAGGSQQNPLNTGYSSRTGPDGGIFAEFKFSDLFSIQPMVEYSSQGGKKDGFQALPTPAPIAQAIQAQGGTAPTYLYANFKSEAKLNYLMIPILAKFGWNFAEKSPWRVYIDAGPFVGFLLNAHQVTSGTSNFYADAGGKQELPYGEQNLNNNQDIKSQLNTTNFGIEGNVGFAYHLKNSYVFVEGGGNYGFLNIQKGTANGKNNTGAATASIGYAYWFR